MNKNNSKAEIITLILPIVIINLLKQQALKLGMPYQTLAASILHRYATGQAIVLNT
jgi:predicted DNA binding CopG/RHH family protein